MDPVRPTRPYPDQSWSGWGDPAQVPELREQVRALLATGLGVKRAPGPPGRLSGVALPAPGLGDDTAAALRGIVGSDAVLVDDESRVRHTRGKSTPDLLLLRAGDASAAPDAVLLPASHQEIVDLLRACSERRIAVVPFGGGTSVGGGPEPDAARGEGVGAL